MTGTAKRRQALVYTESSKSFMIFSSVLFLRMRRKLGRPCALFSKLWLCHTCRSLAGSLCSLCGGSGGIGREARRARGRTKFPNRPTADKACSMARCSGVIRGSVVVAFFFFFCATRTAVKFQRLFLLVDSFAPVRALLQRARRARTAFKAVFTHRMPHLTSCWCAVAGGGLFFV